MFTFEEFEEIFASSKHLLISDILPDDLLDEFQNRRYMSNGLEQKIRLFMRELIIGEDFSIKKFMELKEKFLLQYWWENFDAGILNILRVIQDCLGLRNIIISQNPVKMVETDIVTSNKEQWKKFIALACFIRMAKNNEDTDDIYFGLKMGSDQAYIYESLQYFKNQGLHVEVKNGDFSSELFDTIFNLLDQKIECLGGYFTLEINKYLSQFFKPYGLYYFKASRDYSFNGQNFVYPIGLLYRIGLKHVSKASKYGVETDIKKAVQEIFEISAHLTNILNLVNTGHDIGLASVDHSDILTYMRRYTRLDQFYKIDQYNPDHVFELSHELYKSLSNKALPVEIRKRIDLIMEIFAMCMQEFTSRRSGVFNTTTSYKILVEKHTVNVIELELTNLSHIHSANNRFNSINDFSEVDYYMKPFIKQKMGNIEQYYVPNKYFFFMGFYTQLVVLLRSVKTLDDGKKFNIDGHIGLLQEVIITQRLSQANLKVLGTDGKYNVPQRMVSDLQIKPDKYKSLETDIVVELTDSIIFFESKKKMLTSAAKNGDVIAILNDISAALIDSQVQANLHGRVIKHGGVLQFKDSQKVIHGDRNIIKISITQFDYGSLHTSQIVGAILRSMLNVKIVSDDTDVKVIKAIKQINERLDKLTAEFSDGTSFHDGQNSLIMFANCHFLNFFQILYVLNCVKSKPNLNLATILKKAFGIKQVHTNSLDFYHELDFLLTFEAD